MDIKKLWFILAITMSGCGSELIMHKSVYHTSPLGSEIKLLHKTDFDIVGELIAVDSSTFIIIEKHSGICKKVEFTALNGYKIIYAKDDSHGYTIPLFGLMSAMHGVFSIYSLPINLLTTFGVVFTNKSPYTISEFEEMPGDAYKYARFPQGLPDGVDWRSLSDSARVNR